MQKKMNGSNESSAVFYNAGQLGSEPQKIGSNSEINSHIEFWAIVMQQIYRESTLG